MWIASNVVYDRERADVYKKDLDQYEKEWNAWSKGEKKPTRPVLGVISTADILKSGKGTCFEFSLLYMEMCQGAGLKCDVVRGFPKYANFEPGILVWDRKEQDANTALAASGLGAINHAWK